jgi:4-diphosphocytidyl-2-C-methyl-D-erythritol kinase
MENRSLPQAVTAQCNAKVNLFLKITGKRSDGFHEIETIYHSISLRDTVTVRRAAEGFSVASDDPALPRDATNLAVRAAAGLLGTSGTGGVHIEIEKRIPVAAGLGGGSADAAGTLVAVNRLHGLGRSPEDLGAAARSIGTDVRFMLRGGCAIGRGRGDDLDELPALPPLAVVVVVPSITVSTTWAYASVKMGLTTPHTRLTMIAGAIDRGDVAELCGLLENDFEALVFERFPEIKRIKDELLGLGACGALMSGSGSSVFGIFSKVGDAEASGEALSKQGLTVLIASLAARGVTINL